MDSRIYIHFAFTFPDSPCSGRDDVNAAVKREPVEQDGQVIELKFRVKLPDSAVDRDRFKRLILESGMLLLRRQQ